MATLSFAAHINATRQKVWDTLWADDTYRKWTAAFMEGSYAESDWNEGSRIAFLTPGGEGMYGIIQAKRPYEYMSFKHLGEIKNGVDDPKDWKDASESYQLDESGGGTQLTVTLTFEDSPQFEEYFKEAFPKSLEILKGLAEEDGR